MATTIVFTQDGTGSTFTLADSNALTATIQGVEGNPDLSVNSLKIARKDGEIPISATFGKRSIEIKGKLVGSSPSDFRTRLDNLGTVVNTSGTLDITFPGSTTRRYFVFAENMIVPNMPHGVVACEYDLKLTAFNPAWGEDVSATSVYSNTGVTSTAITISLSNTGRTESNVAIAITQFLIAVDYIVELINMTTGDALQYRTAQNGHSSGMIYAASVLNVNSSKRALSVNALPEDYTGNILTFRPGTNDFRINFLNPLALSNSWTTYNQDQALSSVAVYGQKISPSITTNTVYRLDLLLWKIGSPANLTLNIYNNLGGGLSQTLIATVTIPASTVFNVPTWVPVALSNINMGSGNAPYGIELTSSGANYDADNAIYWKQFSGTGAAGAYDSVGGGGFSTTLSRCFKTWNTTALATLGHTINVTQKNRW